MGTESRNPRSTNLDRMTAQEIVKLMTDEEQIVIDAIRAAEAGLATAAERCARAFQNEGRIIYVGAGTSGRVATADAAEMPPTFGVDSESFLAIIAGGAAAGITANEGAEDELESAVIKLNDIGVNQRDVVIGLAASGTTPFVVSAIRHARQAGAFTVGIANNPNTALLSEAELGILLDTGPEILTGSTRLKAGTSQKLALNRISTAAMVLSGKVVENLMVDVKANNLKLRHRCARIVAELNPTVTKDEAYEMLSQNGWSIRRVLDSLPAREKASV